MSISTLTGKKIPLSLCSIIFILILKTGAAYAQPGTLDPLFGVGGKVILKKNSGYTAAACAAFQANKILLGGFTIDSAGIKDFFVTRLKANGDIDSSFGENGRTNFGALVNNTGDRTIYAIALQTDGRIVLAGKAGQHLAIIRLIPSGKIDKTFGVNGAVIKQVDNGCQATSVVIQPDGTIMAGGTIGNHVGVFSFTNNGNVNTNFGPTATGVARTTINATSYYEKGNALAMQADGKFILVGSSVLSQYSLASSFGTVRYNKYGFEDPGFNQTGKAVFAFGPSDPLRGNFYLDEAHAVAVQQDQKIVVGGYSLTNTNISGPSSAFGLVRYKSNGTLDSSFGTNGMARTFINQGNSFGQSLIIQANQKILMGGYASINLSNKYDFALARYKTNGSYDSSFGVNGVVMTDFGDEKDLSISMLLQNDKIVLIGNTKDSSIALARYNNSNVLPVSLINFIASPGPASTLLKWQTATEFNTDYFSVQRSNDGINFNEIGKVKSNGNSSATQTYTFKDGKPVLGINYYRLKQFDLNGAYSFSKIQVIDYSDKPKITLYPNPVKETLHVQGLPGPISKLQVIDISGKILKQLYVTGDEVSINLQQIPNGLYFIKIVNDKKATVLKFVK